MNWNQVIELPKSAIAMHTISDDESNELKCQRTARFVEHCLI
ncbi:MAG: hypothetical protein NTV94_18050 [Planctomycetota bacterium]|nr:hypothetical protein [Planctomycetota bacterium]